MNRTLDWLRRNENPSGGIAAWPGYKSYPEVNGYLTPTLYEWGAGDLATRCADWLLTVQDESGGFPALDNDGRLHVFDTAACLEGLERAFIESGRGEIGAAGRKARGFIAANQLPNGHYRAWPGLDETRQYCLRVNGIMREEIAYHMSGTNRVHFIAYALEGYLNLGYTDQVRGTLAAIPERADGLMHFALNNWQGDGGNDVIATAQIAILKLKVGLDASRQIAAVRRQVRPNGGVPQSLENQTEMSWGAKFYLDLERIAGGA
jgi:hypothetical protein